MHDAPRFKAPLATEHLRALTLDARLHPRGLGHLSAASGLVCANGRAYVVADDEHHLAVFRDLASPGELHRIAPGDLPAPKAARKRRKPDLEALLLLPPLRANGRAALLAFGSGSRPNRHTGVVIPLSPQGAPLAAVRRFDLSPLYAPLRAALGEINIEGALLIGDELVLLNRGVAGRSESAAARFPLRRLRRVIAGDRAVVAPSAIRRYALGAIDGVPLGFTDGAALPDGGWAFSAVAEDTASSYADGACRGSAIGVVGAGGALRALQRLARPAKVEGIVVRSDAAGMDLCLVTDTDDPRLASCMLRARLDLAPESTTLRPRT
jgi:hypothetical protein